MQKNKENNLFEKIVKKDYKNELEEVLEDKYFGENAKSLLLEILYKIETAYKDYEYIKKDSKTREAYIENFIEIIKNQCKTIKIVKPNSEESKILDNKTFNVNKKRGEIICLPIARKLLYAIYKIEKKDIIVNKKYSLLSTTISNMINVGSNINMVEPLRDFNGWSWTSVSREYESIEYNLIYQNLLILVGEKLLSDWTKNRDTIIDYLEELGDSLANIYGLELAKKIIYIINKLSIIMELKVNPDIKDKIEKLKIKTEKELANFDNKQEYIKKLTAKKNKLANKIMKIDSTISDKKLLQEEYVKRNAKLPLEEKIFSMRVLAEIMIEEREKLFKEMQKTNELLKPKAFLEKKELLQNDYKTIKLTEIEDVEEELQNYLIQLQEVFLECFKIKIKKAQDKSEIIKLIYQYRYYCLLPYSLSNNIFEVGKLQNALQETGKNIIRKAIKAKLIIPFAQNEEINYEIVKNVFHVRIIKLEDLSIKIIKEKEGYFIQFFDDKAFDQKCKLNVDSLDKKILNIKINKKVKFFE
ncbi:MAG: hypothetical protein IKF17_05955 [Clostridia bacterium]|nr:hypothetical protein [Clostridia bacterium]